MAPSGHGWVTVAGRSGTRDPVGRPGPEGAQVPRAARPALLATFRLADSAGGAYAGGRNLAALRDGAASMAIDDTGRISVDQWGRDRRLGPDVVKVRQNLALIVDNGAPVPGLADNDDNRWGNARNQLQYTWRSAIGVDAAGVLHYVVGDDLRLDTLARALADNGPVRGMELDIHGADVRLIGYRQERGPGADQVVVRYARRLAPVPASRPTRLRRAYPALIGRWRLAAYGLDSPSTTAIGARPQPRRSARRTASSSSSRGAPARTSERIRHRSLPRSCSTSTLPASCASIQSSTASAIRAGMAASRCRGKCTAACVVLGWFMIQFSQPEHQATVNSATDFGKRRAAIASRPINKA